MCSFLFFLSDEVPRTHYYIIHYYNSTVQIYQSLYLSYPCTSSKFLRKSSLSFPIGFPGTPSPTILVLFYSLLSASNSLLSIVFMLYFHCKTFCFSIDHFVANFCGYISTILFLFFSKFLFTCFMAALEDRFFRLDLFGKLALFH